MPRNSRTTRRSSVASVLTLQASALAVLTVTALAWVAQAEATRRARIDAPDGTLVVAEQQARLATAAPLAYAVLGDEAQLDRARDAFARTRAGLAVLETLLAPGHVDFATVRRELDRLETAAHALEETRHDGAGAPGDQAARVAELVAAAESLDDAFALLHEQVRQQLTLLDQRTTRGLMALWLAVLVVTLGTIAVTRWRVAVNNRVLLQTIDGSAVQVAHALEVASSGETPPALPDDPLVAPLVRAATHAIGTLDELRGALAHLTRRSSFTQKLVNALAMAECEAEVWETARRATNEVSPSATFQALTPDANSGRFRARLDGVGAACGVETFDRCPAIQKGRLLRHAPDDQLGRCPRLEQLDAVVICAPIAINGTSVAIAQVADHASDQLQYDGLDALSLAVGARLGVVRSLAEREQQAATDPLTGLANRRQLDERLVKVAQAEKPYAVVAADLDHFKELNDLHGHAAGDECLKLFARVLTRASRDSDLPARVGGEEFVILLPGASVNAGLNVAMRVRTLLGQAVKRARVPNFTVSLGVAAFPDHGSTPAVVLHAADKALYEAKASGRDAVVPAPTGPSLELVADRTAETH